MPYPFKTQWRLNSSHATGEGLITVRIGRGHPYYNLSTPTGWPALGSTGHFDLNDLTKFVTAVGGVRKALSEEDGGIMLDQCSITLQNFVAGDTFEGVAYPAETPETHTLAQGDTLFDIICDDPDGVYYIWLTLVREGVADDIYFAGTFTLSDVQRNHGAVANAMTVDEVQRETITITATACGDALKRHTVEELVSGGAFFSIPGEVDGIAESDCIGNGPFYNGLIARDGGFRNTADPATYGATALSLLAADSGEWTSYFDTGAYGRFDGDEYTDAFPYGTWGLHAKTALAKIAELCGFLFDEDDDLVPGLEMTKHAWNAGLYFTQSATDDRVLCYNYIFGVSPWDGSAFESPITFSRATPLADVVRQFAIDFGCVVRMQIDQASGLPRLRLIPRRADNGTLPEEFVLLDDSSKLTTRKSTKKIVRIKTKGADGALLCPSGIEATSDNVIDVEVLFRTRPWGNLSAPAFEGKHIIVDPNKAGGDQDHRFRRYDFTQENLINPDGWPNGAYLYTSQASDTNTSYPLDDQKVRSTWEGFYALRSCTEKSGVYTDRANMMYAHAQLYARELLGGDVELECSFAGVRAAGSRVGDVIPGMTFTRRIQGQTATEWRVVECFSDVQAGITDVKAWPVIDYDTAVDLPVRWELGAGGNTGSAGASDSGGGRGFDDSVGGDVTGNGTPDRIPVWVDENRLGDSQLRDDGESIRNHDNTAVGWLDLFYDGSLHAVYAEHDTSDTTPSGASFAFVQSGPSAQDGMQVVTDGTGISLKVVHQGASSNALQVENTDSSNGNPALVAIGKVAAFINGGLRLKRATGGGGTFNVATGDTIAGVTTVVPIANAVNLPTAASVGTGGIVIIKDESGFSGTTGPVNVTPNGADTIDGAAGATPLGGAFAVMRLYSNGVNGWFTF